MQVNADPMKVLVVTVVHDPRDARISRRQIPALLAGGHSVTFAAPFGAFGAREPGGVRALDLPRARGRRRTAALSAARRLLAREAPRHDIVLLHDPELLLAAEGARILGAPDSTPVVVWDVHEDTAAAMNLKPWLPGVARGAAARAVTGLEKWAEGRCRLMLAEDGYRARFDQQHPVVPNSTPAPEAVVPSGDERVVYVGALTLARGTAEMVELAELLRDEPVHVHLVGSADAAARELIEAAGDVVVWHGFLPNEEALALVDGSLAGLSLLHDEPNYRHSRPTKVIEYMAHGVPVITTPTPPARDLVESASCGVTVPFGDVPAAAAAVRSLRADPVTRQSMADRGRAVAVAEYDWRLDGQQFVRLLEEWVSQSR